MDIAGALENAKAVGREVVRQGLLDGEDVRRLYAEYERFLQRGVHGTFVQLLAARRRIDGRQRRALEAQFAPSPIFDEPATPAGSGSSRSLGTAAEALERMQADGAAGRSAPRAKSTAWARPVGRARLWLECEPLQPIPIGDAGTLTIGRSPECDMVLPHQGVSRRHVEISADGGRAILEDRSTYGVFVNGELRSRHALEAGDVIAVGPYAIVVRDESPDQEDEDTLPFRIPGFPTEALHGKLEDVGLSEVLQQIEFNQKTGTLRVRGGDARGLVTFQSGRPVYAELGPHRGPEAVFAMLALRAGEFSFVLKPEGGLPNVSNTVTGLLLEAGRRVDESQAEA